MDKAQLKLLLGELIKEVLEEQLEGIQDRTERKSEKETKFRRRKKKEAGIDEVPKVRKGKRHITVKDPLNGINLTPQEKKELELASKSDKKNNVHIPKQKTTNRRPSGKIEVRCRVCGKTESVSPAFVLKDEDGYRYKCNRCACSAG